MKNETKSEDIVKPKNKQGRVKKSWILGVTLVVLVVVIGLIVSEVQANAEREKRLEAMEKQRQVLVSHWQEEGLSEQEIQTKLREQRRESMGDFKPSIVQQVMRTFRHATGTGGGGIPGRDGMNRTGGSGSR